LSVCRPRQNQLVETLGAVLGLIRAGVQFTPDLMPADILGSEVLEEASIGAAVFALYGDPYLPNCSWPTKSTGRVPNQSALLQAMQEYHVSSPANGTICAPLSCFSRRPNSA